MSNPQPSTPKSR